MEERGSPRGREGTELRPAGEVTGVWYGGVRVTPMPVQGQGVVGV